MENYRIYGTSPYTAAVIHGGPGAAGEMAPVARELSKSCGILEPLQTADTLEGQVDELRHTLVTFATLPATLIGYSWGAWLAYIVAARFPALVRKLILISSGPFEESCAGQIEETRLERFNEAERVEWRLICESPGDPAAQDRDALLARLGTLASKADSYDPIAANLSEIPDRMPVRADVFQRVWKAAAELRRNGELLQFARDIRCPVVAVHGSYDPHPAEGVRRPLSSHVQDFRFILLKNCGHTPWLEKQAREEFFEVIRRELV